MVKLWQIEIFKSERIEPTYVVRAENRLGEVVEGCAPTCEKAWANMVANLDVKPPLTYVDPVKAARLRTEINK